ncbi:MAG: ABC transporter substrate-binding protein [Burkholderiaceae bacterium]
MLLKHKTLTMTLAAAALACGVPATADTLKIGAVLPMTGTAAVFGEKFQQAYGMAIEEINAAGGVNGKKLVLVIEDSQERPQIGKIATEKLISDPDILVLTGGRSSGVTLVEAQVAEENKVPYLIDHGSSDLATRSGYEYVFRLNPTAGMYPNTLKEYFNENKPRSIVHINVDNAYGEAIYEYGLKDYMKETGIDYKVIKYAAGQLDFKPIMIQAKSSNPQIVIMSAGDDNDATQLIKAAQEADLSPELFVGTGGGHSIMGFAKQGGKLTETVLTAGPWHGDRSQEQFHQFFDKFTKAFGHEPGEHEIEGYSAIYVLADVLKRADPLTREGVRTALAETDIKTIFGQVKFEDFDGYTNQNRAKTDLSQWIGGKMYTVYPKDQAQRDLVKFGGWK